MLARFGANVLAPLGHSQPSVERNGIHVLVVFTEARSDSGASRLLSGVLVLCWHACVACMLALSYRPFGTRGGVFLAKAIPGVRSRVEGLVFVSVQRACNRCRVWRPPRPPERCCRPTCRSTTTSGSSPDMLRHDARIFEAFHAGIGMLLVCSRYQIICTPRCVCVCVCARVRKHSFAGGNFSPTLANKKAAAIFSRGAHQIALLDGDDVQAPTSRCAMCLCSGPMGFVISTFKAGPGWRRLHLCDPLQRGVSVVRALGEVLLPLSRTTPSAA